MGPQRVVVSCFQSFARQCRLSRLRTSHVCKLGNHEMNFDPVEAPSSALFKKPTLTTRRCHNHRRGPRDLHFDANMTSLPNIPSSPFRCSTLDYGFRRLPIRRRLSSFGALRVTVECCGKKAVLLALMLFQCARIAHAAT